MASPLIGVGMNVAGNVVGALGAASAARKKNNILTQGARQQSRAGMESAQVMGDAVSRLLGERGDPAAERGMFSGATGTGSVSVPITASGRAQSDAAAASGGAQGYGQNLADVFARVRAPQLADRRRNQVLQTAGNALRPIQMRAQDDDFMTQFRASNVQQHPLYGIVGQGLAGAGAYAAENPEVWGQLGGQLGKLFKRGS